MYSFIDVNEYQRGKNLPSEAMSINGKYLKMKSRDTALCRWKAENCSKQR